MRAPFDGTITKRFNDEGVYLTTSFRGGTESSVLQIQENHIVVAVVFARARRNDSSASLLAMYSGVAWCSTRYSRFPACSSP